MNLLDLIILILLIPALIRGIGKGMVDMAANVVSLIVSGYLAFLFADKVSGWLSAYIDLNPTLLYIIGFVIIVVVCALLLNILAGALSKTLSRLGLGWIDRTLGVVLGVFATMLVLGLLFSVFADINAKYLSMDVSFMEESVLCRWCRAVCDFVFPFVKNFFSSLG